MIEQINELLDKNLNQNHRDVVDSFRRNLRKYGSLTDRQVDYFHKIASQYTDEALQEQADFGRMLKEDKGFRERLRVVSEYYLRTGYFRTIARSCLFFLEGTGSLPVYEQVNKMMNNKYAQNILESHLNPAKYAVGEMVQLRASFGRDNIKGDDGCLPRKWAWASKDTIKSSSFLVMEVDSCPLSRSLTYCNTKGGTRWYKLLPLGETEPIHVIERELKRPTAKMLRGE